MPLSTRQRRHFAERFVSPLNVTVNEGGKYLGAITASGEWDISSPYPADNLSFPLYWDMGDGRYLHEVEDMRWTCTNCLKLRKHWYFDNHSLFRLAYRKPVYRSEAALSRGTWEPNSGRIPRNIRG